MQCNEYVFFSKKNSLLNYQPSSYIQTGPDLSDPFTTAPFLASQSNPNAISALTSGHGFYVRDVIDALLWGDVAMWAPQHAGKIRPRCLIISAIWLSLSGSPQCPPPVRPRATYPFLSATSGLARIAAAPNKAHRFREKRRRQPSGSAAAQLP